MTAFTNLDRYLRPDYHPDHWSDDAIARATDLVDRLDEGGWRELEATWQTRPAPWQARLADAVFGCAKARVVDLLCEMVKSCEDRVTLAAIESLSARDDAAWLSPTIRPRLEAIRDRVAPGMAGLINDVLARVRPI